MTLPYPLLARGKIIDTDMDLSEKERYEIQVRENCTQLAMHQFNDGKIPFNMAISRAESMSKFILYGINPDSLATEPSEREAARMVGIGSDNRTYPFTNEHGKHFRIEHDEVLNSIIIAYEDGVNVRHTLDELPHAGK